MPGFASAATVKVRDNPDNGGSVFATALKRTVDIEVDGANRRVQAGVFSLQYSSDAGWVDFFTFCLQLHETLRLPKDHERVAGSDYFPSTDDHEALGILFGNFLDESLGLVNANSAAAVQAIVWEIAKDGATSFDLTAGSFKLFTNDVLIQANALWANVLSSAFMPVEFDVFAAAGTQDLLVTQIPLPGGLSLMFADVAGLAFASPPQKRQV